MLSGVLFYLLSTSYVGTKLIQPLENRYPPLSKPLQTKVDAIVVLGGGSYIGTPNLPLMEGAFKRLIYALTLAKRYNLPLIYSGGWDDSKAAKETLAAIAPAFLSQTDLFPTRFQPRFGIYFEDQSRDTYENAQFCRKFLRSYGIANPHILLVTSAFHMPRARMMFDKAGLKTLPAPTDYIASPHARLSFLPTITGFRQSYYALHEYLGLLIYRFKN